MEKPTRKPTPRRKEVIRLEDLAPRKEVAGGAGRLLFGQGTEPSEQPPKKDKSQR
jgi:hypothetical protein